MEPRSRIKHVGQTGRSVANVFGTISISIAILGHALM
jgi:hypothetical protein